MPQSSVIMAGVVQALLAGIAIFLVAALSGMAGAFPVFVLGLFVPGYVVLPLTVFLAGLFSALGAAWMANLLRPGRSTSDLLPIVGHTEAAALLLTAATFVLTFELTVLWPFPGFPVLLVVLALGTVSTVSAWRLRKHGRTLRRDALLTLGLLAASVLLVVLAVFATCSLTPCIP